MPATKRSATAVNGAWDRDESLREGAVTQLRQSAAIDPKKLQVLIAHGWNDLSCPFMGSVLAVDQMPPMGGDAGRVRVREYPGGHMFYSRPDSQARFQGRRARPVRARLKPHIDK
jgi:carboxypeptidase C (cathepsin A)